MVLVDFVVTKNVTRTQNSKELTTSNQQLVQTMQLKNQQAKNFVEQQRLKLVVGIFRSNLFLGFLDCR
jgi:hypothetical protein